MRLVSFVILATFIASFAVDVAWLSAMRTLGSLRAEAAGGINVWWPTEGAIVSGVQPLKAVFEGLDVHAYTMTWNVSGGGESDMPTNYADYPHKETTIDFTNWTWLGRGPYALTLTARDQGGAVIATKTVSVYVGGAEPITLVQITQVPVEVWWPTEGAALSGTVPLKAIVPGKGLTEYQMFWQVDGGAESVMGDNYTGSPHKEALVDVSGWNWQASGAYTLTFIAKDSRGNAIGKKDVPIKVNVSEVLAPAPTLMKAQNLPTEAKNPLADVTLYVNPDSPAAAQAREWRYMRPSDASKMDVLARAATAAWFGDWNRDVEGDVRALVSRSGTALPVLVAYNIPNRDCGGYSKGGTVSADAYRAWVRSIASGIGSHSAVVILEPDALAKMDCLPAAEQSLRRSLIQEAVSVLKKNAGVRVYIDAGHSGWVDVQTMADRLRASGIAAADGFALNVSNFQTTGDSAAYGARISEIVGGAHFVIDTSRNGNGANNEWCNPKGRAIGNAPTTATGNPLADAYLWIKTPGESDGSCNGGPSAGVWWPEYALGLVR